MLAMSRVAKSAEGMPVAIPNSARLRIEISLDPKRVVLRRDSVFFHVEHLAGMPLIP
jgi:hypothetical protein